LTLIARIEDNNGGGCCVNRTSMTSRGHSVKLMAEAQRLIIGKRDGEREGISR